MSLGRWTEAGEVGARPGPLRDPDPVDFFFLLSLRSSKDPPGIVVFREEGLGQYRWCISQS